MNIPHELVEQFARGNGAVFVGAGTSIGAGLPSWEDLIKKRLVPELDDCPSEDSYTRIAQYYIEAYGRNRLVTRLRQELRDRDIDVKPTIVHELLVNLPIKHMFTTNYDDLLEQALLGLRCEYHLIVKNKDICLQDMAQLQLVKLHGDLSQHESIIITSDDYDQYFYKNTALAQLLIHSLQAHTILFLGCSMTDSNFTNMLTQARNQTENVARNSFVLTYNSNKYRDKTLERKGLHVIKLEVDNGSEDMGSYIEKNHNQLLNQLYANWLQEFDKRIRAEQNRQTKKPKPPHKTLPSGPYKFLDYFTSKDTEIFFGRQQEKQKTIDLILIYRLAILYGESGTGKTSFLQASVLPYLKENKKFLIVYTRPLSNPLSELKKALLDALPHKLEREEEPTISLLNIVEKELPEGNQMLIVLDQFEEFFIRQNEEVRTEFVRELGELLSTSKCNLHCLISLRSDYLHRLDELELPLGKDPLLHRMRLYPLGSVAASEAITKPMTAFKVPFDSMLVDKLVQDLREVEIAPAQLQIVCYGLWQDWRNLGKPEEGITLDRYLELGGTKAFLANYLDDVIEKLENLKVRNDFKLELDGESSQKTARAILKSMVTSEQTKVAANIREITQHEIMNKLAVPEEQAEILLKYLCEKRVIRRLPDSKQYELAHEVMVEKIWKWLDKEEQHLLDIKDELAAAMNSYRKFETKTLVSLDQMNRLTEQANQLFPNSDELELLLKSAINHGIDTEIWIKRMETSDAVNILSKQLESETTNRPQIAKALGYTRTPKALRYLKKLLLDKNDVVQRAAAKALVYINEPEAIHVLNQAIKEETKLGRAAKIIDALKQNPNIEAVSILVEIASEHPNNDVCLCARNALSHLDHSVNVNTLIEQLIHNKPVIREVATNALKEGRTQEVLRELKVMLDSNDLHARLKAVGALETIGYARAKDLIIHALYNENPLIREKSVNILGLSGDKTVVNLIIDQLGDENINVLKASFRALHSLLKDSMVEALHHYDIKKTKQAIKALGKVNEDWVFELLMTFLQDEDSEFRQLTFQALSQFGSDCLEVIEDNDKSWGVVWPILWEQAKDQDENVEILKERARVWLRQIIDKHRGVHPGWSHVWRAILKDNQNDEGLLKLGFDWLESAQDEDKGWGFVWLRLMDSANNKKVEEKLVEHAQAWL